MYPSYKDQAKMLLGREQRTMPMAEYSIHPSQPPPPPARSQPQLVPASGMYTASHAAQQLSPEGGAMYYYPSVAPSDQTSRYHAAHSGSSGSHPTRAQAGNSNSVAAPKHSAVYPTAGSIQSGLPIPTVHRADKTAGFPRSAAQNSLGQMRVHTSHSQAASFNAGLIVSPPVSYPHTVQANLPSNVNSSRGVLYKNSSGMSSSSGYMQTSHLDHKTSAPIETQTSSQLHRSGGAMFQAPVIPNYNTSSKQVDKQNCYAPQPSMSHVNTSGKLTVPVQSAPSQVSMQVLSRHPPDRSGHTSEGSKYDSAASSVSHHRLQPASSVLCYVPKSSMQASYGHKGGLEDSPRCLAPVSHQYQSRTQTLPNTATVDPGLAGYTGSRSCQVSRTQIVTPNNATIASSDYGQHSGRSDIVDSQIEAAKRGPVPLDLSGSPTVASSTRAVAETPLDLSVKTRKREADTMLDLSISGVEARSSPPVKKLCTKLDSPVDLRARDGGVSVMTATVPQPQKYTYSMESSQKYDIKIQQNIYPNSGHYGKDSSYDSSPKHVLSKLHQSRFDPVQHRHHNSGDYNASNVGQIRTVDIMKSPVKFEEQGMSYPSPPEIDAYPSATPCPQRLAPAQAPATSQSVEVAKRIVPFMNPSDSTRQNSQTILSPSLRMKPELHSNNMYQKSALMSTPPRPPLSSHTPPRPLLSSHTPPRPLLSSHTPPRPPLSSHTPPRPPLSSHFSDNSLGSSNKSSHNSHSATSSTCLDMQRQTQALQYHTQQRLQQQQQQQQLKQQQQQQQHRQQAHVSQQLLSHQHHQVLQHQHHLQQQQQHMQQQQQQKQQQQHPPQQQVVSHQTGHPICSSQFYSGNVPSEKDVYQKRDQSTCSMKVDRLQQAPTGTFSPDSNTKVSNTGPGIQMKLLSSSGYLVAAGSKEQLTKSHMSRAPLPKSDLALQPAAEEQQSASATPDVQITRVTVTSSHKESLSENVNEHTDIAKFAEPLRIAIPTTSSNNEQKSVPRSVQVTMPKMLSKKHRILNSLNQDEDQRKVNLLSSHPVSHISPHLHRKMPTISPSSPASPKMPILSPHDKIPPPEDTSLHNEPPQLDPPATPVKSRLVSAAKCGTTKDTGPKGQVLAQKDNVPVESSVRSGDSYLRPDIMRRNSLPERPSMYQKNIPVANVAPFVHSKHEPVAAAAANVGQTPGRELTLNPASASGHHEDKMAANNNAHNKDVQHPSRDMTTHVVGNVLEKRLKSESKKMPLKKCNQYMAHSDKLCKTTPRKKELKVSTCPLKYKLLNATTDLKELESKSELRERQSKGDVREIQGVTRSLNVNKQSLRPRQKRPLSKRTKVARRPLRLAKRARLEDGGDSEGFEVHKQQQQPRSSTHRAAADAKMTGQEAPTSLARQERALRRAVIRIDRIESCDNRSSRSDQVQGRSRQGEAADSLQGPVGRREQPSSPTRRAAASLKRAHELKRKAIDGPRRRGATRRVSARTPLARYTARDVPQQTLQTMTRNRCAGRRRASQYNRNAAYEKELRKDESRRAFNRAKRRVARLRKDGKDDVSEVTVDADYDGDEDDTDGCWEISRSTHSQRYALGSGRNKGGLMMKLYYRPGQDSPLTRGRRPRHGDATCLQGTCPRTGLQRNNPRGGRSRPRGKLKVKAKFQSQFEQFLQQDFAPESYYVDESFEMVAGDLEGATRYRVETPTGEVTWYPIPPELKKLAINKNSGETLLHRAARSYQ